ncbi:hypothetical protein [Rubrobacter xylanophilus]|uniref:hypothetical protein n=1 Tax=Rubrobacter xylanophilus TaxID=49319 RepID=UPI001C63BD7A|nr:hypothetical protein [Rubrobacter xylanophilus]
MNFASGPLQDVEGGGDPVEPVVVGLAVMTACRTTPWERGRCGVGRKALSVPSRTV